MTDEKQPPRPEPNSRPPSGDASGPPKRPGDDAPLAAVFRALRLFLVPFLFSWALAYVGSERDIEWLYFTGLGGVGLSMLVLLVWLIS